MLLAFGSHSQCKQSLTMTNNTTVILTTFRPSTLLRWYRFMLLWRGMCAVGGMRVLVWEKKAAGAVTDKAKWFPGMGLSLCLLNSLFLLPSFVFWSLCLINCTEKHSNNGENIYIIKTLRFFNIQEMGLWRCAETAVPLATECY